MDAKDLAQDSLGSVAHDRAPQSSGYGNAYATVADTVLQSEDRDQPPAHTSAVVVHREELAARGESVGAWKAVWGRWVRPRDASALFCDDGQ